MKNNRIKNEEFKTRLNEKDMQLQKLQHSVRKKNEVIEALESQVKDLDIALSKTRSLALEQSMAINEIYRSRIWKLITISRTIRNLVLPYDSRLRTYSHKIFSIVHNLFRRNKKQQIAQLPILDKSHGTQSSEIAKHQDSQIGDRSTSKIGKGIGSLNITWVMLDPKIGSGGQRNVFRVIYYLEKFGHKNSIYILNSEKSDAKLSKLIRKNFYPMKCPIRKYTGTINKTDVLFATHSTTVNSVLSHRNLADELIYLVQDCEPMLYPIGTKAILAENTYKQGIYHITSGIWCEKFLREKYKAEADHFKFPIDTSLYYPRERTNKDRCIIFFAKPELPRRCYEIGIFALEHFHKMKPDIKIILFGSDVVKSKIIPFPAEVLGVLPTLDDLAKLYSNADLGIVFSTTNPSLVPYEMMSCGLPVVDLRLEGNDVNYGGRYDIAFLANPDPAMMAYEISQLLDNRSELESRRKNGLEFTKTFPTESEMAKRVESLILNRFL